MASLLCCSCCGVTKNFTARKNLLGKSKDFRLVLEKIFKSKSVPIAITQQLLHGYVCKPCCNKLRKFSDVENGLINLTTQFEHHLWHFFFQVQVFCYTSSHSTIYSVHVE